MITPRCGTRRIWNVRKQSVAALASVRSHGSIRVRFPPARCRWYSTHARRVRWFRILPARSMAPRSRARPVFFGTRWAQSCSPMAFTLSTIPCASAGLRSHPFDGEGVVCKKLALVEDGVLRSWLLDSATARELGLVTTGNAQRARLVGDFTRTQQSVFGAGPIEPRTRLSRILPTDFTSPT